MPPSRQSYLVDLLIRDAQEEEDDSELLLAEDDEAGNLRQDIKHVAEGFVALDGNTVSGDVAVTEVPQKLVIDDHCNFKSTYLKPDTELATSAI